jgi:SPP1 family predicted phage head-tail adaptor
MPFNRETKKSRSTNRRHLITVQRITRTTNVDGDAVVAKSTIGPYWASVDPMNERQRVDYQTIGTECTHYIRCNGKLDIRETDNILFDGRVFEILTIVNLHEVDRDKLITTKELRPMQAL